MKNGKIHANKVHGYRLNHFTAADIAHKRFVAIEVVDSSPLPQQISGESVVSHLIIPAQGILMDSFGLSVLFPII